jgi:hypothetical protein
MNSEMSADLDINLKLYNLLCLLSSSGFHFFIMCYEQRATLNEFHTIFKH